MQGKNKQPDQRLPNPSDDDFFDQIMLPIQAVPKRQFIASDISKIKTEQDIGVSIDADFVGMRDISPVSKLPTNIIIDEKNFEMLA